jgi:mRNA interferase HigB
MHVVGREALLNFGRCHAAAEPSIRSWLAEVEDAKWNSPADIKKRYAHASILNQNTIIFNLKGNKYRLQMKINFAAQVVQVERIGTHAEYSKWTF